MRVQAIGTAFSVQRRGDGAEVQVTEGVVEVWSTGLGAKRRVAAGSEVVVSASRGVTAAKQASSEIERQLAWRGGQIILEGETLGAAAAEFNRHNVKQIVLADPALGSERLVGRFRTNEPESFAIAAAGMLDLQARKAGDQIVISAGQ